MSTGRTERRHGGLVIAAIGLLTAGVAAAVVYHGYRSDHRVEPAPGPAPQGMVWVPGGSARIGSDHGMPDEAPAHKVTMAGFWLDRTPVTVAQFAQFARHSGYVTTAEKLGSSEVMQFGTGQWQLVKGASWRAPFGPGSHAQADHPVTQVSWYDAQAYCQARSRRLPTEAEWEYTARYGHDAHDAYAFGPRLVVDGHYRANVWTGSFPGINTAADGYRTTSPVGAFGANALGLTDMAGNVWEWSANWYRPYGQNKANWTPGPAAQKAMRGGSFLCDGKVCDGFSVAVRAHATPDSSLMQVGFRCAADARHKSRLAGLN